MNDVWCRDHGPLFVKNQTTGEVAVDGPMFVTVSVYGLGTEVTTTVTELAGMANVPEFVATA